jgi:hypothetical protein
MTLTYYLDLVDCITSSWNESIKVEDTPTFNYLSLIQSVPYENAKAYSSELYTFNTLCYTYMLQ